MSKRFWVRIRNMSTLSRLKVNLASAAVSFVGVGLGIAFESPFGMVVNLGTLLFNLLLAGVNYSQLEKGKP